MGSSHSRPKTWPEMGSAQSGRSEAYRESKNGKEGCRTGETDSQSPGKHGKAARVEQGSPSGGGQLWSKVMHELTSSSHKSQNQKWIHDGRSIEVEWLVESLYSSQGEGEGERERGGSLLLPDKYTCSFPFPQTCISSAVFVVYGFVTHK